MAQGPDGKTIIIVKKVVGHGGHHGGSWKVAYADFVTSMMAFFMVLWLVNSASVPVRERIASYFRAPGVFEKGSGTPLEVGNAGILPDTFAPPAERNSQVAPNNRIYEVISPDGEQRDVFGDGGGQADAKQGKTADQQKSDQQKAAQQQQMEQVAAEIKASIEKDAEKIEGLIGKVEVKVDQRGLHLEIMDTPKASMFSRGSAEILPPARAQLQKITAILMKLPNPLDIEGHTDSAPFKGIRLNYSNWDLSTDRANSARRILTSSGIAEKQVARVVGYGAQRPKTPEDTLAATNRRISISMRFTEQAAGALKDAPVKETHPVPLGKTNAPVDKANSAKGQSGAKAGSKTGLNSDKNLDVTINVTQPEGTPISPPKPPEEDISGRPVWMEKDKIFGDKNPFLPSN